MNFRQARGIGGDATDWLTKTCSPPTILANMDKLLSLSYWFDLTPVRMSVPFEIGFFIGFSLVIVAGLVCRILRKGNKDKFEREVLARITTLLFWIGSLGLIWLGLAYEEIQIFGARFWIIPLFIITLISLISTYRYHKIQVPQLRLAEQSKAEANKYLPRRR